MQGLHTLQSNERLSLFLGATKDNESGLEVKVSIIFHHGFLQLDIQFRQRLEVFVQDIIDVHGGKHLLNSDAVILVLNTLVDINDVTGTKDAGNTGR